MCKGGGWGEQEHEQEEEEEQEEEQQQQRRRRGDAPKASQKLVRISLLHQPIILSGSQVFLLLPTNCNNTLASLPVSDLLKTIPPSGTQQQH